jgi:hypothetical protein
VVFTLFGLRKLFQLHLISLNPARAPAID